MGKGKNHKGGRKQFTNFEEIEKEKEREEKAKAWRARKGDGGEESEEESSKSEEESSDEKTSENESENEAEGEEAKPKSAVQNLIEVNNPNRIVKKANKNIDLNAAEGAPAVQLSRREREELSKQQAKENYARLTAEGKTEQARADLARLAIIRKQREEAQRKKEEERMAREAAKAQATAGKFAGVKSVSANVTEATTSTKGKGKRK
ncbi:28 kDa heat- and acid-stable phosphoprotein-like protein [Leptotrombidium deliense]|uniref:28 kDa heat-and acid-stable phosphoprotein-like protein n=1 Tax=Leptotrombidium deliense TaxID=299467 RepID=A0A443S5M3_9ACAR|nr:28 kDa heat- and acid-stable phosphoprotein-like protein [Leptotrombidium deliense]